MNNLRQSYPAEIRRLAAEDPKALFRRIRYGDDELALLVVRNHKSDSQISMLRTAVQTRTLIAQAARWSSPAAVEIASDKELAGFRASPGPMVRILGYNAVRYHPAAALQSLKDREIYSLMTFKEGSPGWVNCPLAFVAIRYQSAARYALGVPELRDLLWDKTRLVEMIRTLHGPETPKAALARVETRLGQAVALLEKQGGGIKDDSGMLLAELLRQLSTERGSAL